MNATDGFTLVESVGENCPIARWELWPTARQTLEEYDGSEIQHWPLFVSVDPATGAITVNHNDNPVEDQGNQTFVFHLTALSVGMVKATKEVRLHILYPFVN